MLAVRDLIVLVSWMSISRYHPIAPQVAASPGDRPFLTRAII
jgi:hypothetical protein